MGVFNSFAYFQEEAKAGAAVEFGAVVYNRLAVHILKNQIRTAVLRFWQFDRCFRTDSSSRP